MEKKKVITAYVATFLVFMFQTIDVFFIHTDASIFGGNVVARLAGLVVFIFASLFLKFNVKNFCFRSYGFVFEIIIGALYAIVPAAICYGAEYLVLLTKGYDNLTLHIDFPNTSDAMGLKWKIIAVGLYMFTVLLQSLFKELFFRGFLITQLFDKYKIRNAIIIQAFLYTIMLVPTIVQYIITGRFDSFGLKMTLFIIFCNLFIDIVSGLKWGIFYRVNGTVWMSTADHFVNNMILTCVYITYGQMPMKWFVIQAVAVQLLSFAMFIPLYFRRDRQNEEIATEMAVRRELAGLPVDDYAPSGVRRYIEGKRFEFQAEYAKKRNMPPPDRPLSLQPEFEEPVSLRDMEFAPSERMFETIDVISPVEADAEPKRVAHDVTANPSEMSKQFFEEKTVGNTDEQAKAEPQVQKQKAPKADEVDTSSSDISQLVKGYFEDNFNKYTFEQK
ncbi:MAG: CPBP family intramembrane metalloprotease [Clostridia bacterium]|nr:CPBP family intramembrane metalloprotease [Clostridia bacterium]